MKISVTAFLFAISFSLYSQSSELVPNPGFENTKGKVKGAGQIETAIGWRAGTLDPPDLFSKTSKIPDFSVPANNVGSEDANDGGNYAGIVAQSPKDSKPRTYLQTELSQPLEADKLYCVKFFVTLADLSKFACNDLGAYISSAPITSVEILKFQVVPQVLNPKNRIFQEMDFWEPICATFQAKGGEKFLTIGNFAKGTDDEMAKIKRPKGFTKPQINMAYYYIDNVSVMPLEEVESCYCEKVEKKEVMNIVYTKSVSAIEKEDKESYKQVGNMKVFFDFKSAGISINTGKELTEIARILNENPDVKIDIQGHSENQEQVVADLAGLSESRAKNVFYYLSAKGVNESRMTYKGMENSAPMSKDPSPVGRAKNRRVEFKISE